MPTDVVESAVTAERDQLAFANEKLRDVVSEQKSFLEDLSIKCEARRRAIKSLEGEVAELKLKLVDKEREIQVVREDKKVREGQLDELRIMLREVGDRSRLQETIIAGHERTNGDLRAEITDLKADLRDSRQFGSRDANALRDAIEERDALKKQLAEMKAWKRSHLFEYRKRVAERNTAEALAKVKSAR